MKIIKAVLRYWFAIVSALSFLVGWGMLAHSLKPVQPVQAATANVSSLPSLPSLPPIQAFGSGGGNGSGSGLNFAAPSTQSNLGAPLLRSGGS
jgi:hypothetical protein